MQASDVFGGSPLLRWAESDFEVGTMLFSYFWLSWCLQNDTPRATDFPGRSRNCEKCFLWFSSHNTACHFQEEKRKDMPQLLLWECSSPLVSTFPVCEGWFCAGRCYVQLCFLLHLCHFSPAEPLLLNNTPRKTLLPCNLSQSLEEIFSLLVTGLVSDFVLAAGCKVGSLLYYPSLHLWGRIKDSQHSRMPWLYCRLLRTVNEVEEYCIVSGSFI